MRKISLIFLLFVVTNCVAQEWQAEITAGTAGYNGDLTQSWISLKNIGPAAGFNIKYDFENSVVLRAGLGWGKVSGNDKNNKQTDLKDRNLNFKSSILEGSVCVEVTLLDPQYFYASPYVFGGIGIFHFDPYTYDKDNKKTYLQSLSTEGQGIPGYPERKPYSLTQVCFPLGAGWKVNINKKWDIVYELGYRILLTDYLDDVSTTYVNAETLLTYKGPKSVELAFKQRTAPGSTFPPNGDTRGNSKIKDWYFFSGIKLLVHLGEKHQR